MKIVDVIIDQYEINLLFGANEAKTTATPL